MPYAGELLFLGGDEEVGGVDLVLLERGQSVEIDGVHFFYGVHLVIPEGYSQHVVAVCHEDVHGVSPHAEISSLKVDVVAHVQGVHQSPQQLVAVECLSSSQCYDAFRHRRRSPHSVDARDGGHYHHVPSPTEQSGDGRQPEAVDFLVDVEVFLYVSVCGREVCFRLVVVVVGDIIFHGVVGEESAHLLVELRCECLVVAQDECRPVDVGDDIGHGEGLPRPGDAEQHLCAVATVQSFR